MLISYVISLFLLTQLVHLTVAQNAQMAAPAGYGNYLISSQSPSAIGGNMPPPSASGNFPQPSGPSGPSNNGNFQQQQQQQPQLPSVAGGSTGTFPPPSAAGGSGSGANGNNPSPSSGPGNSGQNGQSTFPAPPPSGSGATATGQSSSSSNGPGATFPVSAPSGSAANAAFPQPPPGGNGYNVTLNSQVPFPPPPPNSLTTFQSQNGLPAYVPPYPNPPVQLPILPGGSPDRKGINISIIVPIGSRRYPYPNGIEVSQGCSCVPYGYCIQYNTAPNSFGNAINCPPGLLQCCQGIGSTQCGIRYFPVPNAPIAEPGEAQYGSYPWQAAILGPGEEFIGSGALISATYVVTVAHTIIIYVTNPEVLRIRLGEWDGSGAVEPIRPQEFFSVSIVINPYFNVVNLQNDIALVRLGNPVALGASPTIGTVCLPPPRYSFDGSSCWVSGWGQNSLTSGTNQYIQKEVNVAVLPDVICQAQLSNTRFGPPFIFDPFSFMCAGGQPGSDACTGDAGSPLVCSINGQWFVAGLVAWGIGCGTISVPGVYVKVTTYVPWIQSIIEL